MRLTVRFSRRLKFGVHRHYYGGWTLRLGFLRVDRTPGEKVD